jgi:hypothetical protein
VKARDFLFADEPGSVSADVDLGSGVTLLLTRAEADVDAWEVWGIEIAERKFRERSPIGPDDGPENLIPDGAFKSALIAAEAEWREFDAPKANNDLSGGRVSEGW